MGRIPSLFPVWAIPLGLVFALTPWASAATALFVGAAAALLFGNPYLAITRKTTKPLLAWSIVGLGAGVDLGVVARAGLQGFLFTAVALTVTLALGWLIGRAVGTDRRTSILVCVGTAICGGSAIAAVSTAIRARDHETSVALGVVFVLNACALFCFPTFGHWLHMSEGQFGLWCALAIHDTSSVVGAAMQYGPHALEIGTTVKLVRALWIVPVTFVIARFVAPPADGAARAGKPVKRSIPWFIGGFLLGSAVVTAVPALGPAAHIVDFIAKRGLVISLFLIGAGLTRATLKEVGLKPFLQAVLLWLIVGSANLVVALHSAM